MSENRIRLGRFDKWGYKNSFSKGELARELVYTNEDNDALKEEIERLNNIIKGQQEDIEEYNDKLNEVVKERNKYLHITNELEKYIKVDLYHVIPTWRLDTQYAFGESTIYEYILNKIKKLKENTK